MGFLKESHKEDILLSRMLHLKWSALLILVTSFFIKEHGIKIWAIPPNKKALNIDNRTMHISNKSTQHRRSLTINELASAVSYPSQYLTQNI